MSNSWLVPRTDLTTDQLRGVEISPAQSRLFYGPPGSGKTLVLLHRARHLLDRHRVPPDRLHFFAFTKSLSSYIAAALHDLRLPGDCISTFDSWCARFHRTHISSTPPRVDGFTDYDGIAAEVCELVAANPSRYREFDHVLVDEAQDLRPVDLRILSNISTVVTACADPRQQLYESRATESDILRELGIGRRSVSLLEAYRCCPYIARLAGHFIPDNDERRQYLNQARTEQIERERPVLVSAANSDEEFAALATAIGRRLERNERLAILLYRKRDAIRTTHELRRRGLSVEAPVRRPKKGAKDKLAPLNFETDLPKVMTYHGAKGLTFDTVFMPRLLDKSFPDRYLSEERIRNLLYVGVTRATRWLYMSTQDERELRTLSSLGFLGGNTDLQIRRPSDSLFGNRSTLASPDPTQPADELDDLL